MKYSKSYDIFEELARCGVLHRDAVRGRERTLQRLCRQGWVAKRPKQRRVYYELTEQALPLLEQYRQKLLKDLGVLVKLQPRSRLYWALAEDVRFVDEHHPEAQRFLLLGDWQLHRPLVPAQLELAKHRFYTKEFSA